MSSSLSRSDTSLKTETSTPITMSAWAPFYVGTQAWTRQFVEANIGMQREWLSFVGKRLQADLALAEAVVRCETPDQILGTYSQFLQKAFADYQNEFTTFARFGGAMAGEVIEAVEVMQGLDVEPYPMTEPQGRVRKHPSMPVQPN